MTAILKLFIFSMTFAGYLKTGREYPMTKAMLFRAVPASLFGKGSQDLAMNNFPVCRCG
jgi:hypothetical protein